MKERTFFFPACAHDRIVPCEGSQGGRQALKAAHEETFSSNIGFRVRKAVLPLCPADCRQRRQEQDPDKSHPLQVNPVTFLRWPRVPLCGRLVGTGGPAVEIFVLLLHVLSCLCFSQFYVLPVCPGSSATRKTIICSIQRTWDHAARR